MSQVIDVPLVPAAQINVQDLFLNQIRRERQSVLVHLMGGQQFEARVTSFDRFAVVVEVEGGEQLIFKHAIAAIAVSRPTGAPQASDVRPASPRS